MSNKEKVIANALKRRREKFNRSETVGELVVKLHDKKQEVRDPIALQREMQKDYIENLKICVQDHYKIFKGDYYIVVTTKAERLMPNVIRNYFAARETCPSPVYDQSVFKYNRKDENLEYIWTVPSLDAAIHLRDNANVVAPEEQDLLIMVLKFFDGELLALAKRLNKEENQSKFIVYN